MPVDARMRLESVSKIWTGVLIHQLAEEGKLRLSDSVERWLPGLLPYGDRITVAQLLTHTSGLIDNNDVAKNPDAYIADVTDPAVKEQLLRVKRRLEQTPMLEFSPLLWIELASFQPLLAEPGTLYHYSNIGFEILGLIAARAGGRSIESLYRERIFEPLALRNTAYDPQGPIAGEHARGYAVAPGGPLRDMTAAHAGIGAEGAVVSNAEETARFLVALMQGKLLGPEQLELMKTSGFWSGGDPTGCGGVAYGHSGGGAAFKTNVWVSGDGRRVAVLLLNGRGDAAADARAGAAMIRLYCAAVSQSPRGERFAGPCRRAVDLRRRRGDRRSPHGHGCVRRARAGVRPTDHIVSAFSRWHCSRPPPPVSGWVAQDCARCSRSGSVSSLSRGSPSRSRMRARSACAATTGPAFALAPAGLALIGLGFVLLWRSRKRSGRRYMGGR